MLLQPCVWYSREQIMWPLVQTLWNFPEWIVEFIHGVTVTKKFPFPNSIAHCSLLTSVGDSWRALIGWFQQNWRLSSVDKMLLLFEFCDKTVGYWWQGSSVGELVSEWWAEGNWGGHASPSPCPLSYEGGKILHKYINICLWGYAWCFLGFHECNLLRRQKHLLLDCEPHSM